MLKEGRWSYNDFFAQVGYAKAWGRLPSEFMLCAPEDDFILMSAYCNAQNTMDAYDAQLEAERLAKIAKRGNRRR